MERHRTGADQASAELQRTSRATNTELRLVAEELAGTGALPSAVGTGPD